MLRRVIVECHGQLPPRQREVLDLRVGSADAEPDVALAERLDMRLNTFLQNFTRARNLLLDCLRTHGVELGEHA